MPTTGMPVGKGEEEGRVLQLRFGVKVPSSLAEPKRNSGSAPGGIRTTERNKYRCSLVRLG